VIVPDTSVLVAGFVSGHRFHREAASALAEVRAGGRLIAHTIAETFAVLSAAGGVYRADPRTVVAYLDQFLERPASPIQLRPDAHREALEILVDAGRAGGAVYDALIALAARGAGAALVSFDRRAEPTYELCGVEARMLAGA
jgi:predicted nucleic acid-binding protein